MKRKTGFCFFSHLTQKPATPWPFQVHGSSRRDSPESKCLLDSGKKAEIGFWLNEAAICVSLLKTWSQNIKYHQNYSAVRLTDNRCVTRWIFRLFKVLWCELLMFISLFAGLFICLVVCFVCLFVDHLAELGEDRVKDGHRLKLFHILCIKKNSTTGRSGRRVRKFFCSVPKWKSQRQFLDTTTLCKSANAILQSAFFFKAPQIQYYKDKYIKQSKLFTNCDNCEEYIEIQIEALDMFGW